jgi:dTDP-4-amino-4,6-dideoxygalactose transaminase
LKEKYGIDRNELFKRLSAKGIASSVHFTPLHLLTLYKEAGYGKQSFPVAERVSKEIMSLPLFPTISKSQMDLVTKEISQNSKFKK